MQSESLFPGHDQPRHPADMGYCDLRVPEVRLAQADLARAYGVDAFCYSHYWFEGQRLFEQVCLCWAKESWLLPGIGAMGDAGEGRLK